MSMFAGAAPALCIGGVVAPQSHPGAPSTAPPAVFVSGVTPAPPGSVATPTTMFAGTASASASSGVDAASAAHPETPTTFPPAMFPSAVAPAPPESVAPPSSIFPDAATAASTTSGVVAAPATTDGGCTTAMNITTTVPTPGEGESS